MGIIPKVSVVMGVYNNKSYDELKQAVFSIINQSFKEWEFIICDDGSTNDTYAQIDKVSSLDERIIVLKHNKNQGLAAALNTCIKHAKGEYIARQDPDDYSDLERLDTQVKFMDEHPEYAIVGTIVNLIDSNGVWGVRGREGEPLAKDFLYGTRFNHPSVMMRKQALLQVGCYRIAKETRRAEDYDLFMRMYACGMRGYNLANPLFYYREGRQDYNKRKYKFRIDEAVVRYKGFKKMGLMPRGIPYVFKPLIVGLIPASVMYRLKRIGSQQDI